MRVTARVPGAMVQAAMRATGPRFGVARARMPYAGGPMAEMATRLAVAFVIALALSPFIHQVTAGLTATIGQRWPFVLEHCRTSETPGCAPAVPHALLGRLAVR